MYIAIDLKSFYASQECVDRGLNPLGTNLVVADESRTDKTICLAVTPPLKALGVPGRARLFEAKQIVKGINARRRLKAPGKEFKGKSCDAEELSRDPSLELDFIIAPPRMARYMESSTEIFNIYSRFVAPEDIHVYSIDEVFINAAPYLGVWGLSAHDFARMLIKQVLDETGITATAGIGPNLYLCKVAMDIMAKRISPDRDGVRIAELDEMSYRRELWSHTPITDFWRVGRGYAKRLESYGLRTMGDVARCSAGKCGDFYSEELLYRLFGVNAELLIDHAWGWESCTIADIKAYRPQSSSLSSGQVLQEPYEFSKARIIAREMTDLMVLELVEKGLVTDQLTITVGYDIENLTDPVISRLYKGPVTTDHYGRRVPKHAHGSIKLKTPCASTKLIMAAAEELFDRITNPALLVRRLTLGVNVFYERELPREEGPEQLDLFTDHEAEERRRAEEKTLLQRERRRQQAIIGIREKYGKNAMLRGFNFEEGATTIERNRQVGGHRA